MKEKNNVKTVIAGGLFFLLSISIIIGAAVLIVSAFANMNSASLESVGKLFLGNEYSIKILAVKFVGLVFIPILIASIISYYAAYYYVFCGNIICFSSSLMKIINDFLTRFPALLIGVLGFFIFIFQLNVAWNFYSQCGLLVIMLLPSLFDAFIIAMKNNNSIIDGIILSAIRVWLEIIILIYSLIFITASISLEILSKSSNISEFISQIMENGLSMSSNSNIPNIIILLLIISVLNAIINWFYKNYALRQFKKNK
ncbi:MAG TPA: hypothetical protein PKY81_00230 [bacterium]|nr:hypothetical protein [bacterium]